MATYEPLNFGPHTPQQVVARFAQEYGFAVPDFYTVVYNGITHAGYSDYYVYTVTVVETASLTMQGTNFVFSPGTNTVQTTSSVRFIRYSAGYNTQTDSFGFPSTGTGGWTNGILTLSSMCDSGVAWSSTPLTWATTNMYGTINITNLDDGSYNYQSQAEQAEFICTKDPDLYLIHLGVRANRNSNYSDYAYQTSAYTIRLKWTSPVTGYSYTYNVPSLTENVARYTHNTTLNTYNFSYTETIGTYAKGIRTPVGTYAVVPAFVWDDLTDVPSFRDVPLSELRAYAQTQHSGITNDDIFTVITAEFVYNSTVSATKTVDFSSLLGEDIDIEGATVPNPNGEPSIADDNVYTDSIDLTTPTLTATGIFNRCYLLDGNGVNDLCDFLYNANDSIFEEIIDGVLTRGNPIESLIDLRLYPFDISTFTHSSTAEFIKFGRTNTGIAGLKLAHDANAIIDLGHCTVPRYYNNFLDYQTTAELYIPFCGVVDIPIERVLNHTLSIKLIVDYVTGAGTAVVYVDKIPLIYQQGVIGVSIPMTATDSAALGQTIAGNLINGASAMLSQNPSAIARETADAAANLWEGSRLLRIGASSPQTSLFQPLNAYLLLSLVAPADGAYSDEYAQSVGYACFMPVSQISYMTGAGFTAFDNVKLNISQATENEKEMILSLLKSGVYI